MDGCLETLNTTDGSSKKKQVSAVFLTTDFAYFSITWKMFKLQTKFDGFKLYIQLYIWWKGTERKHKSMVIITGIWLIVIVWVRNEWGYHRRAVRRLRPTYPGCSTALPDSLLRISDAAVRAFLWSNFRRFLCQAHCGRQCPGNRRTERTQNYCPTRH